MAGEQLDIVGLQESTDAHARGHAEGLLEAAAILDAWARDKEALHADTLAGLSARFRALAGSSSVATYELRVAERVCGPLRSHLKYQGCHPVPAAFLPVLLVAQNAGLGPIPLQIRGWKGEWVPARLVRCSDGTITSMAAESSEGVNDAELPPPDDDPEPCKDLPPPDEEVVSPERIERNSSR